MNPYTYQTMLNASENAPNGPFNPEWYLLSDSIDKLTHVERIKLRNELTKIGEERHIRTLYYDYEKQVWIQ